GPVTNRRLPARSALARRTGLALASLVDPQRTAAHVHAIGRLNGFQGICRRHVDEAETARTARLTIVHQFHRLHTAVLFEQLAHFRIGSAERKISNVDRRHRCSLIHGKNSSRPPSRLPAGAAWTEGTDCALVVRIELMADRAGMPD